jgi:replicative DNA helicase
MPLLSDLRDSGSIEQDADSVLFLYRHGYYFPEHDQNECTIIVAKNRHGSLSLNDEKMIITSGLFKSKLNG